MEYLKELNEHQKAVVLYNDGPLAVLSSAGVGKTKTLVTKILYLLKEKNIKPSRIVACTLTKKAAEEIKDRLTKIIGKEVTEKLRISTIHSLAYKIFKGGRLSIDPYYSMPSILSNPIFYMMPLLLHAKKIGLSNKAVVTHLKDIGFQKVMGNDLAQYKKEIQFDTQVQKAGEPSRYPYVCCVAATWEEYNKACLKFNKIDFADILLGAYKVMTLPAYEIFKNDYTSKIEHLLVDEAQDTSTLNFKIIYELAQSRNVTIIGDRRQSIFAFAGANVSNIPNFIKHYNAKIIDLPKNYRSTKAIVENSNKFMTHYPELLGAPAVTDNPIGEQVIYYRSKSDGEEAITIADKINSLIKSGVNPSEIAVIYRAHSLSQQIELELVFANIKYKTYIETSFYRKKEVQDILTYLALFLRPEKMNKTMLQRIANKPVRYISNDVFMHISKVKDTQGGSFYSALTDVVDDHRSPLSEYAINGLTRLLKDISTGQSRYQSGSKVCDLINYILKDMGYEKFVEKENQDNELDSDLIMNLDSIRTTAEKFSDLEDFLEFIDAMEMRTKDLKDNDESDDLVQLMSIHKAKGREFEHVFVVGISNKTYPFYRAEDVLEEHRIFYVAITRPKHQLYLSAIEGQLGRFETISSPFMSMQNFAYAGATNDSNHCGFQLTNEKRDQNVKEFFINYEKEKENGKGKKQSTRSNQKEDTDDEDSRPF